MFYQFVSRHLPYLFHIITLLVCTGPISMRASTHGLVINISHSLFTCGKPVLSGGFNSICSFILEKLFL
jgi:neurofibromin 1